MHPDLEALIRREFGLAASEAGGGRIAHAKDPRLPQFGFEWHPETQKVYRVDYPGVWAEGVYRETGGAQAVGRCIAEHCLTHGQFYGFVQTFCRGYLLAARHAAEGALGHKAPERLVAPEKECDPCPTR